MKCVFIYVDRRYTNGIGILLGFDSLTPKIVIQRIDEYVYELVQLLRNNRYNINS